MEEKRIMSGMRPTGKLHLGNLFGALENWVKLQNEYKCFFSIVDWHALTTGYEDTSDLQRYIREMTIDWLSAGIDPEKATVFVQSHVKEHAELHLLLSMITPISWLERNPTYKDQLKQLKEKNISTHGFLGYPVLQSADILAYKAEKVPVGEDQLPHLELSREIARRFNYLYKPIFPEPQAILNEVKILPGIDGRKMSKSYNNTIEISDDAATIRQKVSKMITDPQRIRKTDPGNPEICTVYAFHKVFSDLEKREEIDEECRKGAIGCVDCKKRLAEIMIETLNPIIQRRQELIKKPDYIDDVLQEGKKRAEEVAKQTLNEVREAMNLV